MPRQVRVVSHHERFGVLALQVHAAQGGEKVEIAFPSNDEKTVSRAPEAAHGTLKGWWAKFHLGLVSDPGRDATPATLRVAMRAGRSVAGGKLVPGLGQLQRRSFLVAALLFRASPGADPARKSGVLLRFVPALSLFQSLASRR
jgi:hypothetical protein